MSALPRLSVLKNGQEIQSLPLEGELMLGRAEACGLRLEDRAISRQHALFRSTPDGVEVERKSDFAPLLVNGVDCTSAMIREGDVVQIGPYRLRLSGAPAAAPASAAAPLELASAAAPSASAPEEGATEVAPSIELMGLGAEAAPAEAPAESSEEVEEATRVESFSGSSHEVPGLELESMSSSDPAPAPQGIEAVGFSAPDPSLQSAITHKVVHAGEDDRTLVADPKKILQVGLVLEPGAANVTHFELDRDEVSIGRDKSCDIVLNDKKSSRRHAIIVRAGMHFVLKDMASANGLFLNGAPVREQQLYHGDKIRIGTTVIEFQAVSPEYARREKNFMEVPPPEPSVVEQVASPLAEPMASPVYAPPPQAVQAPIAQAIPTQSPFGELPGIDPVAAGATPPLPKNASLTEKFKALPMKRKVIWVIIAAVLSWELLGPEDEPPPPPKKPVANATAKPDPTASMSPELAFEALSPEKKKFVESQFELAFTHLKNKEYDKSIFEVQKIFAYVSDYKNAREIERYAVEGKRKLEALEEERRKAALEAKLKAEVAELVAQAELRMKEKKYDELNALFAEILARDPENKQVVAWRQEIEAYHARIAEEAKIAEVRKRVSEYAWAELKAAQAIHKQGRYKAAIAAYGKVLSIDSADQRPQAQARAGIARAKAAIRDTLAPVLAEARAKEQAGEMKPAYELYRRATRLDEDHPEGYQGMRRIRGALELRAKEAYTEAVLAESFSDFALARKKYRETMEISPADGLYYERAQRKLSRWVGKFGDDSQGRDVASDAASGVPASPEGGGP